MLASSSDKEFNISSGDMRKLFTSLKRSDAAPLVSFFAGANKVFKITG